MKLRQNITLKRQCHEIVDTYFLPYETLNWPLLCSCLHCQQLCGHRILAFRNPNIQTLKGQSVADTRIGISNKSTSICMY